MATFYCTAHGKNRIHNTDNCFTLKNKQQGSTQHKTGKRTFTPKGLRHEINLLCNSMPKDKVLEQYMAVIQQEKAKLKKKRAKKSKAAGHPTEEPDSDSSTDVEMNMIEEISPTKSKKHKLKHHEEESLEDYEKSEEEIVYCASIYTKDPESSNET